MRTTEPAQATVRKPLGMAEKEHSPHAYQNLDFRVAGCFRLPTVPDSIQDSIIAKNLKDSTFLCSHSMGTFPAMFE